jgi:hypothetical protein
MTILTKGLWQEDARKTNKGIRNCVCQPAACVNDDVVDQVLQAVKNVRIIQEF